MWKQASVAALVSALLGSVSCGGGTDDGAVQKRIEIVAAEHQWFARPSITDENHGPLEMPLLDVCKAAVTATELHSSTPKRVLARAVKYATTTFDVAEGNLAPKGRRAGESTVKTSPDFAPGRLPVPYNRSGYDTLDTLRLCKNRSYPSVKSPSDKLLYLWGVSEPSGRWNRTSGMLGLDCNGFVTKAYGGCETEYASPSAIYVASDKFRDKDFTPENARPGRLLAYYSVSPEPANDQVHFMIIEGIIDGGSEGDTRVSVIEAGCPALHVKSDFEVSGCDRVHRAEYPWSVLEEHNEIGNVDFVILKPHALIENVEEEVIEVPVDGSTVSTQTSFNAGETVRIEATGSIVWGKCDPGDCPDAGGCKYMRLGDANYVTEDCWASHYVYGGLMSLHVDDSPVAWGEYNSRHRYVMEAEGKGGALRFRYADGACCYGDNQGVFTVRVSRVVDEPTCALWDSAGLGSPPDSGVDLQF